MYYLRQQTQISGPFTVDQLKSLLHRGRIARSDKISADKVTWTTIADCPEIIQRPVAVSQPTQAAVAAGPVDDGLQWFHTLRGHEQPTAVGTAALKAMILGGTLDGDEMVWRQGFDEWKPLSGVAEFAADLAAQVPAVPPLPGTELPPGGGPAPTPRPEPPAGMDAARFQAFVAKKVPAGVVALVLGPLGIHKFMLGLTTGGVTMLVLCLLVIPIPFLSLAAFAEGLLYLTKTDEAFYRDYAVDRKQWF